MTSCCISDIRCDKAGFIRQFSSICQIMIWYAVVIVKHNSEQNYLKLCRKFILLMIWVNSSGHCVCRVPVHAISKLLIKI